MGKLQRGDWLEVIREVRQAVKDASDELDKWENRSRGDRGLTGDVDKYIDQMTPAWKIKYRRIAESKDTLAGKRREWNNLKKKALSGKDETLTLAWMEWMFESDTLSQGFDEIQSVLPESFDPNTDPRFRAAMLRGGHPLPEQPS